MQVEARRGGLTETVHPVSAALFVDGGVRWSVGPNLASFWRSGCKAMQLTTSLEALPGFNFTPQELAIGAASHSGQPLHTALVEALLARFELSEADLRCGAHRPMHEASARALDRAGLAATPLHNNCSGKHTFMRAASKYSGWEDDYRPPEHPLQRRNTARMTEWMGDAPQVAVDGCGVPSFFGPLWAQARAVARLADEMRAGSLAGQIAWAMQQHPLLMSGEGRLDALVVQAAAEPLCVKVGAEGLFTIALPERAAGIVVKVHTGNDLALGVAVQAVLEHVYPGILGTPDWPFGRVKNVVGRLVGDRVAVW